MNQKPKQLIQASACIDSHSSRMDWKRIVDRYLSPKLGNTTCQPFPETQSSHKNISYFYFASSKRKNFLVCIKAVMHTAISFPAFSGLFPTLIAAAAAAPEDMPTFILDQ